MDPNPKLGPRIKLADFGFAVITDAENGVGMKVALGSRFFMAPELIIGGELHTSAIDIWAVGVLAFYLLTYGAYPFPGTTKEIINNKIKTMEPELHKIRCSDGDQAAANAIKFIDS